MKRMQALCLMPSITYFHKKMDQFGKGHDQDILKKVTNEAKRNTKPRPRKVLEDAESTASLKANVDSVIIENEQSSSNNGKKMLESFAMIMESGDLDMEQPSTTKKLLIFPNRKATNINNFEVEGAPKSMEPTTSTSQSDANDYDLVVNSLIPADSGRKLVLDNVDIHQVTHHMTEEYQNPDAHFCSLMATENRVSGKHLPDTQPICNLIG